MFPLKFSAFPRAHKVWYQHKFLFFLLLLHNQSIKRLQYNLNNFFKITGTLNNVFRPQKIKLKKTRIKLHNTLALPFLLYGSETWTVKASDARRITAAEMKYTRRTAGYTCTDYRTNAQIAKEFKITPILGKLLEYKRSWIQQVNRMPRDRLPRIMKHYCPTGRRNRGRPLKRLLDTWDRNGSTSGLTPWQTYDDDDDTRVCVMQFWPPDDEHMCSKHVEAWNET